MTPTMMLAKVKLIEDQTWKPDLATTDDLLSGLAKLRRTDGVRNAIDIVLDYRRVEQARELLTWQPTPSS